MRRTLAALLLASAAPFAAAMNPFSNDATDLWWNPNESGWGLNLIQQSNVLFATLFVYDGSANPHWYVASSMTAANVADDRPYVFSGRLYETTGPSFFGVGFNPALVNVRDVGGITFEFVPPNNGMLSYSVDGVAVSKKVTRQTWRTNNVAGTYSGAQILQKSPGAAASCSPKVGLQPFETISIVLADTTFSMTATSAAAPVEQCRYTGTYSQAGHMGAVDGVYACDSGANGTFRLLELEVGTHGLSASVVATDRACGVYGNLSAIRKE